MAFIWKNRALFTKVVSDLFITWADKQQLEDSQKRNVWDSIVGIISIIENANSENGFDSLMEEIAPQLENMENILPPEVQSEFIQGVDYLRKSPYKLLFLWLQSLTPVTQSV